MDDETSTDLAAAVQMLTDRQAIANLIHAYCEHFDANDPEAVGALFTDDAVVDYGARGADHHRRPRRDRHADRGRPRADLRRHEPPRLERPHRAGRPGHGEQPLLPLRLAPLRRRLPDGELWGRYRHTFRRTDDGWRIASLRLEAAGSADFHRATMHAIGRRPPAAG